MGGRGEAPPATCQRSRAMCQPREEAYGKAAKAQRGKREEEGSRRGGEEEEGKKNGASHRTTAAHTKYDKNVLAWKRCFLH